MVSYGTRGKRQSILTTRGVTLNSTTVVKKPNRLIFWHY